MLSLFLSLLFIPQELPKGPMFPLEKEKLKQQIYLKDKCKKVSIIEWKQTDKSSFQTSDSINVISEICNLSVSRFYEFSKIKKKNELVQTLSLLSKGSKYRELNDSASRFYYRSGNYINGQIIPILGYHQRNASHIYIFNSVMIKVNNDWKGNPDFKKILAHEFYHALSYQSGLFNSRHADKQQTEQVFAQKFVSSYKW